MLKGCVSRGFNHATFDNVFRLAEYWVGLVVWQLGWADLDLGSSPGWWAAAVATYCPSRPGEHSKSKSTQPSCQTTSPTLYLNLIYNAIRKQAELKVLET